MWICGRSRSLQRSKKPKPGLAPSWPPSSQHFSLFRYRMDEEDMCPYLRLSPARQVQPSALGPPLGEGIVLRRAIQAQSRLSVHLAPHRHIRQLDDPHEGVCTLSPPGAVRDDVAQDVWPEAGDRARSPGRAARTGRSPRSRPQPMGCMRQRSSSPNISLCGNAATNRSIQLTWYWSRPRDLGSVTGEITYGGTRYGFKVYPRLVHTIKGCRSRLQGDKPK